MRNLLPASKRFVALLCGLLAYTAFFVNPAAAQVDTVFWFVAPYVNVHHGLNKLNLVNDTDHDDFYGGGRPIYLKISSLSNAVNVTISVPAIDSILMEIPIPPNSTEEIRMDQWADLIVVSREGNKIENKGLLIQSDDYITAYYENATIQNPDLFALKGRNALGQFFYTPFQNQWPNDPRHNANHDDPIESKTDQPIFCYDTIWGGVNNDSIVGFENKQTSGCPNGWNTEGYVYGTADWPPIDYIENPGQQLFADSAFSAFDIVATENNTTITITPSTDIVGHPAGVPFDTVLHRGQTYTARAVRQGVTKETVVEDAKYNTWAAHNKVLIVEDNKEDDNLSGSKIVASAPIAVTIKDDSIFENDEDLSRSGACEDFVGDQLVPVELTGSEYIVMRGELDPQNVKEHVFIVAVEDSVVIDVKDENGNLTGTYNLDAGETASHSLCADNVVSNCTPFSLIKSKNGRKFYVFHLSGYECEMAGAILPPLDKCTGSDQVGFTRTYGGGAWTPTSDQERFFMNLLVKSSSVSPGANFEILTKGTKDNNATQQLTNASFQTISGTEWVSAQVEFSRDNLDHGAHLIRNSEDLFHMSFINSTAYQWGSSAVLTGSLYGYFSNFAEAIPDANIVKPTSKFQDSVYIDPGQKYGFWAVGGVSYSWRGEVLDSITSAWTSIDASLYLDNLTAYNPSGCCLNKKGSYRFIVDIKNSCYPNASDTLYVFIEPFIPPYQITDTVCDLNDDPNIYLSQYYKLNHLNDTVLGVRGIAAGNEVVGWYTAVDGGVFDVDDFEGNGEFVKSVSTNGVVSVVADVEDPTNSVSYVLKTESSGSTLAAERTVSVRYEFSKPVNLSEGYDFTFDYKYDGGDSDPSHYTNNTILVKLISPTETVSASAKTISTAAMETPQWITQNFSFRDDSSKLGFTHFEISIVSTFDQAVDYGFYFDNLQREFKDHYELIENDSSYVFTEHYNMIIAQVESPDGRFVMDTNYVWVKPTGRATKDSVFDPECRLETDSLCGIDLRDWKYDIGGALVGEKFWYRSVKETVDTVLYIDSIANIENVCVMGEDTLYAHVQDRCYKYGSLIFDVVPTPDLKDTAALDTLCANQLLGGKTVETDLTAYESSYFKPTAYQWEIEWYTTDVYIPSNLIADPTSVIVQNGDVFYGAVNVKGKNLCPEFITLEFVVNEMPVLVFDDDEFCDYDSIKTLSALPADGEFSIDGAVVADFNPQLFSDKVTEIIYSVTVDECPWADTAVYTVHSAPDISIAAIDTIHYGLDSVVDASVANGSGDFTYTWTYNETADNVVGVLDQEDLEIKQFFKKDTFNLLVVDNITGCKDSLSEPIAIKGAPLFVYLSTPDTPLCKFNDARLNALIEGGVGPFSLEWSTGATRDTSEVLTDGIVVSPLVTTDYYVTVTDHGDRDTTVADTITIAVYENPSVNAAITAADITVCQNTALQLDGSATGGNGPLVYTWSGANATLLSGTNIPNPNFNSASTVGTYNFDLQVVDSLNCMDTVKVAVAILDLPVYTRPADTVVCSRWDYTYDLNVDASSTVTWSGNTDVLKVAGDKPKVFADKDGMYGLNYVVSNGSCSLADTITFVVKLRPEISVADIKICSGIDGSTTAVLNTETASLTPTYAWYENLTTDLNEPTQTLTYNSTVLGDHSIMTVAITNDMVQCTDTAHSTITINENPTVVINPDLADNKIIGSFGNSYLVAWYADLEMIATVSKGKPDYTYVWTSNDSLVAGTDLKQTAVHNDFRSAGTDYTVTVTDANGCTATNTKRFYANSPKNNLFVEACDGKQFPENTPVTSMPSCPDCKLTDPAEAIKCNEEAFSSKFEVCVGESIDLLTVTNDFADASDIQHNWQIQTLGDDGTWSEKKDLAIALNANNYVPSNDAKPINFGRQVKLFVGVKSKFMPEFIYSEITGTIHPNPTPRLEVTETLIAGTDSMQYQLYAAVDTDTPDDTLTYSWSGPITFAVEDSLLDDSVFIYQRMDVDYTSNPSLSLYVKDVHGCTGSLSRSAYPLRVEASPICENNTAYYNIYNLPKDAELKFYPSMPANWTYISYVDNSKLVPVEASYHIYSADWTETANGDTMFTVYAEKANSTTGIWDLILGDNVTQIVNPYPEVNIYGPADVCIGATTEYSVSNNGGISWNLASYKRLSKVGGEFNTISVHENDTSTVDIQWDRVGKDSLSVNVYDGCPSSDFMYVNVHDNPVAQFDFTPKDNLIKGTEVTFINSSKGEKDDSELEYYWDFAGGGIFTSEQINPIYSGYDEIGVFTVQLIVYDANFGCVDTATASLVVNANPNCNILYPNTVIPESETLEYREFGSYDRVGIVEQDFTLKIFNRWNALVWETNDPTDKWDCYYNSSIVEQGNYIYQSIAKCENGQVVKQNGNVTVLR